MRLPDCPELARFLRGELELHSFPHREHVRMAFELLRRHDFACSVHRYSDALRTMTARAGKSHAFNQTVTIAFLSLIAERMELAAASDFASLVRAHPELLDPKLLSRWYRPGRLGSDAARRTFLMPDPPAAAAAAPAPADP
jgi:hypothetical protein